MFFLFLLFKKFCPIFLRCNCHSVTLFIDAFNFEPDPRNVSTMVGRGTSKRAPRWQREHNERKNIAKKKYNAEGGMGNRQNTVRRGYLSRVCKSTEMLWNWVVVLEGPTPPHRKLRLQGDEVLLLIHTHRRRTKPKGRLGTSYRLVKRFDPAPKIVICFAPTIKGPPLIYLITMHSWISINLKIIGTATTSFRSVLGSENFRTLKFGNLEILKFWDFGIF